MALTTTTNVILKTLFGTLFENFRQYLDYCPGSIQDTCKCWLR